MPPTWIAVPGAAVRRAPSRFPSCADDEDVTDDAPDYVAGRSDAGFHLAAAVVGRDTRGYHAAVSRSRTRGVGGSDGDPVDQQLEPWPNILARTPPKPTTATIRFRRYRSAGDNGEDENRFAEYNRRAGDGVSRLLAGRQRRC